MNCCCGLIVEKVDEEPVRVPLTGVSVRARIIGLVAEVCIEQSYVNKEETPIEAVYKFPLDEGAAVCEFSAEIEGRVIKGVVKETEIAETDYEEAIKSGRSAFLVEEKLPDVFKAKVGNLSPGSEAKICLTYITELKVEGNESRFYLPTTIAPRYIPASDKSSAAKDLANIPYTEKSLFAMEFEAKIQMTSAIKEIRCPTHNISVLKDEANSLANCVRLAESITALDRDLVLYIAVSDPHQPHLICEKSEDGSNALMLSLVPSFQLAEQKSELIFVVDRSGSMRGPGINQAKQALKLFLHSLPADCYVNIVGFGSSYVPLFPASRQYDDQVLSETKDYAEKLDGDFGGTEIHQPLEWIFQRPCVEGYLRQVLLLTDGEVSNADDAISLVRKNNSRARVFALGLGDGASHHLVEGVARAGNGSALFASLEERLEKKVLQQLQDALQPALTDVKLEWEGYEPDGSRKKSTVKTELQDKSIRELIQAPSSCPPVFDGRHLAVYALLEHGAPLPDSVTVSAVSPVGPLVVKVVHTKCEAGLTIHRLAAKKRIQELQDRDGESDEMITKTIVDLGCRYGLASRYTSFVAVDPKGQSILKESWMMMQSRDVPNTLAHGWGVMYQTQALMCSMPMPRGVMCSVPVEAMAGASYDFCDTYQAESCVIERESGQSLDELGNEIGIPLMLDGEPDLANFKITDQDNEAEVNEPEKPDADLNNDDKLLKIVSTQSFNGAFKPNTELAVLLGTTLDEIADVGRTGEYSEPLWSTVLALAFMAIVLPDLQDSWMMVAAKAMKWLYSQQTDYEKAKLDAEAFIKLKMSV